jgi:DNA-binding transcriptional MerR regulator
MRIGELSRRTGVPARLLRYYEEQDLLYPERDSNEYRCYGAADVYRVEQIRGLLDSGLTTEIIAGSCRSSTAGSTCPRSA